jgi:cellulose synthase/poly-beta-1,6-N-acetylglucosamine synthase-like glycosyltransferase
MFIESLMWIFGLVLLVLFLFLAFTGVIIFISLFKKPKYDPYTPKVSVIIPVYNESKNIVKCLTKIFASSYPKNLYEVIVVDDGSTDNTLELVKKFKNVKILYTRHQGKSIALNYGIKHASNEILLTVDADTFLYPDAMTKMVLPFNNPIVGATIGTYKVGNRKNMWTAFQTIEYSYNSLIRMAFSRVFNNSVWFYGAMSCYRADALKKIGYMHADVLTEDMDVAIRLNNKGYNIIHVYDAFSDTLVPDTFSSLIKQRTRWWTGVLQAMRKHRSASYKNIRSRPSVPLIFVYLNQWWWSLFSIICFPMYIIQVLYWLPYNLATFTDTFMYLFRWFSLLGPAYVLYKIPEWGINFYSIFGILSGVISVTFIIISVTIFKEAIRLREVLALIFYFPYTLVLNVIMMISVIRHLLFDSKGFKK